MILSFRKHYINSALVEDMWFVQNDDWGQANFCVQFASGRYEVFASITHNEMRYLEGELSEKEPLTERVPVVRKLRLERG
jgi:hypothetical protein